VRFFKTAVLLVTMAGIFSCTQPALASQHKITPGETLWSIAASHHISVASLAQANGIGPGTSLILTGSRLDIPADPSQSHPGLVRIYQPDSATYLAPSAAKSWNDMRGLSIQLLGIDLYPSGPDSAYRSHSEQAHLYSLYKQGKGNLAASPGQSEHERGVAVDVATRQMRWAVDRIGARYGWRGSVSSEWWHVSHSG
jgi:LysM repeat protein